MFDRLLSKKYYFSYQLMLLFIISLNLYVLLCLFIQRLIYSLFLFERFIINYIEVLLYILILFLFIRKKNIFSALNFVIKKII